MTEVAMFQSASKSFKSDSHLAFSTLYVVSRFFPLFQCVEKVRGAVVPHISNVRTVRGARPYIKKQCAGVHYLSNMLYIVCIPLYGVFNAEE